MSEEKNPHSSSPTDEKPDMQAGQTGESSTLPVESGAQEDDQDGKSNGQSSEAPVTG
jgi:hypothetical protein